MFNLELGLYICDTPGFLRIMYLIKVLLNLIRFAVPIILMLMIAIDLFKNVINPKEKEGMKKIVNRLTAAVIVFFVPTMVSLVLYLMDYVLDSNSDDYKISSCYTNASMKCVNKIDDYLNCNELGDEITKEKKACKEYRKCNTYTLSGDCGIKTVENDICKKINQEVGIKYRKFGN